MSPSGGWFSYEDVPLKWHNPVGLLYDLYSGNEPAYPGKQTDGAVMSSSAGQYIRHAESRDEESSSTWRLTVHFTDWPEQQLVKLDSEGKILHDAFINSVKEVSLIHAYLFCDSNHSLTSSLQADFLRNGTAKAVMSLSKDDSTQLWEAVKKRTLFFSHVPYPAILTHLVPLRDSLPLFNAVNQKLLSPPGGSLRHIPIKLYLPMAADTGADSSTLTSAGSVRVVQSLVTPSLSSREFFVSFAMRSTLKVF